VRQRGDACQVHVGALDPTVYTIQDVSLHPDGRYGFLRPGLRAPRRPTASPEAATLSAGQYKEDDQQSDRQID